MRVSWFASVFAAAIIAVIVYSALRQADSGRSVDSDARTVYCLAPANAAALAQAASALGLASVAVTGNRLVLGSSVLTPAAWRAARPADFDRACAAFSVPQFAQADSNSNSSLTTGLAVLVQVGGGAVLTLVIDNYRIAAERSRTEANTLRGAWQSFTRQVNTYVEARRTVSPLGIPVIGPVDAERENVISALQLVKARHPRWHKPDELAERLRTGVLGSSSLADTNKWPPDEEGRAERQATSHAVNASLSTVGDDVLEVANALESPIRLRRQ